MVELGGKGGVRESSAVEMEHYAQGEERIESLTEHGWLGGLEEEEKGRADRRLLLVLVLLRSVCCVGLW